MIPGDRLGDKLHGGRTEMFVGREREIETFDRLFDASSATRVLYVHGPAGIGKTMLVHACLERARSNGLETRFVDLQWISTSGRGFIEEIRRSWNRSDTGVDHAVEATSPFVLAIDSADERGSAQVQLFAEFVPSLPATARVVMAGRKPPDPRWHTDPGWRALTTSLELNPLSRDEVAAYLEKREQDPRHLDAVYAATHGHPLALSLIADALERSPEGELDITGSPEIVQALVARLVKEAPTLRHRHALGLGGLVRTITTDMLEAGLGIDDGTELFDWLAGLSFSRVEAGGIVLHELPQDVLMADLQWRDPGAFLSLVQRVLECELHQLEYAVGEIRRRAIAEILFTMRRAGDALMPIYELGDIGGLHVERAHPAHWDAIRDMVRRHETQQSLEHLDRWRDRNAETFVCVDEDEVVQGFLMFLRLDEIEGSDAADDPGVGPIHSILAATNTSDGGTDPTQALLVRFWMTDEAHQGICSAQTRIFLFIIETMLTTPRLRSVVAVHHNPKMWAALAEVTAFEYFPECDFRIGELEFGILGVRFDRQGLFEWMSRCVQVSTGLPVTELERPTPLSKEEFGVGVRAALRQFDRPDLLHENPLLEARFVRSRCAPGAGPSERARALLDAIVEQASTFAGSEREDALYQVLHRTYFDPAPKQRAAAYDLGLPFGTYRRYRAQAVERLTEMLWQLEQET